MKIRLAGGVVADGRCVWVAGSPGPVHAAEAPAGAAVVLGPAEATDEQVRHAVDELGRLVAAGGVVAAGANVDLGEGFRSARLDGARGDQRDAVLAALRVLGVENAHRLGDRAGFLVALFGPAVTRRVGAAAALAMSEGRWAALHLAVAASDTLGPEQVEQVLALRAPENVTPDGPPSALAHHLRQVLEPVPRPRRLELVLDLWAQVLEHHAGLARRERRLATQSRHDRVGDLRRRRRHDDDELVLRWLGTYEGRQPSLAAAARWIPPDAYWSEVLARLLQDALATTALLRTAVAVADHGLEDGLARSAALIRAADAETGRVVTQPTRRVPGLTGLPAHPIAYVRDIHRRLTDGTPHDAKFAGYIRPRLACARDFALLVIETAAELLYDYTDVPERVRQRWARSDLRNWRAGAGYGRPPAAWDGIAPWTVPLLGSEEPLSRRLAASADAAGVEMAGDLLWYADLIDALAELYGHDAARVTPGTGAPWFDHDPPPPDEPLTPRLDSVTLAVSGAAQLVALGGTPPKGVRTWRGLTEGLLAGTAIAEALTGEFAVPAVLTALDGTAVPGTGVRFRVARDARTLAEWSEYMGNCIAGSYYLEEARTGRSCLAGLYGEDGTLLVNAELVARRPAVRGWRVEEIAARFNNSPDPALEKRFRDWVDTIPGKAADVAAADGTQPDDAPPVRPARKRSASRLIEEAGPALDALARQAWDEEALGTFARLAGTPPEAALTRLRRLGPARLADACRRALDAGAVDLDALWAAGGIRPLTTAVEALDPAVRDRFDGLSLLVDGSPLPKSLRKLVKLPAVADAYALDLVARATRRAIGELANRDDPVIARAIAGRPAEPLLCALTVMVTCRAPAVDLTPVAPPRAVTVPGHPATSLADEDGPWQRAFPLAREMDADTGRFWDAIAEHGLRVPASWLGAGGWPALWSRAHRRER
ncbi:hypothetical protein [Actinoallomurus iriomotensis]|uniref:Uncharacterized protein n=1 Tax=Actinoallomurus iriomotensis TaxID=478107 RepID=A0A9W6W5H6_9ACTN|nr:hypothetical protein [Actinoallomurus iriomotensis]GLY91494.1 hypothetical protein Airi02_094230 [Actinoallomurus iriomotensis]